MSLRSLRVSEGKKETLIHKIKVFTCVQGLNKDKFKQKFVLFRQEKKINTYRYRI